MATEHTIEQLQNMVWRTGTKLGRTVYARVGKDASPEDVFLGIFDTPELALHAVMTHNLLLSERYWNSQH